MQKSRRSEACRVYAKSAALGLETQNRAAELKLRAERKAGDILLGLKLRGGDRRSKSQIATLRLSDLGVTKDQSFRWQRVASVPEVVFCSYIQHAKKQGLALTTTGLLKLTERVTPPPTATPNRWKNGCVGGELPPGPHRDDSTPQLREITSELSNHIRLLADVLQPIATASDDHIELRSGQRRVLQHLLLEMEALISMMPKDSPGTS